MPPEPGRLPSSGDVVGGKYAVDRVLGKGGMGVVLAVRHLGLDEPRALKLMLPLGLTLPQARERFFREARAASKLRSEHAVRIHDVGVFEDGCPYIEMELLTGRDLAAVIKRRESPAVGEALRWMAEAADAVGEAHRLGIVHRDLKPGNLFLAARPDGSSSIRVLDFGIAKVQTFETDPSLTGTSVAFGSPVYMSPEQMRGARHAEPASDVWSLGVILYELLTLRRPFEGESLTALALAVAQDAHAPIRGQRPDLPEAVCALVDRCLSKRPAERFASAQELGVALRQLQATLGPPAAALPVPAGPFPAGPAPVSPGSHPSLPSLQLAPAPPVSQPSLPIAPGFALSQPSLPGVPLGGDGGGTATAGSLTTSALWPAPPPRRRLGLVVGSILVGGIALGGLVAVATRSSSTGGNAASTPTAQSALPARSAAAAPPSGRAASPSASSPGPTAGPAEPAASAEPAAGAEPAPAASAEPQAAAGAASTRPTSPRPPSAPGARPKPGGKAPPSGFGGID